MTQPWQQPSTSSGTQQGTPSSSGNSVNAEIETLSRLGKRMHAGNDSLQPGLKNTRQAFKMDENNYRSADYAMARGLAKVSPRAKSAMDAQDTAMWSAGWVMDSHVKGNKSLGNISMHIAKAFESDDALNASEVDKIREVTGIQPDKPLPPWIKQVFGF